MNIDKVAQDHDEALQKFRNKFCEYEKCTASEQIYQRVMQNQ
ncbi:CDP-glycerol glycerophosphotransferase family protein [Erysipelatoclostridium ramosum]|nr:CDP-glycerol glycerophosphotransferase family protein [Thomasclavelia ramosa]